MALGMIFLYGPPGAGKSRLGRALASRLGLPFWDLDAEIEARSRKKIPAIFAREGESGFRRRERAVLAQLIKHGQGVLALGGGALLNEGNLALAEAAGTVLCLRAPRETLAERLGQDENQRPLLDGDMQTRLDELLQTRAGHYASFALQLDVSAPFDQVLHEAQTLLGAFHVRGMGSGYDVRVIEGGLGRIGVEMAERGLRGPVMLVSDENVASYYANTVMASLREAGYAAHCTVIPAGEQHKTLASVEKLWPAFLEAGLERGSTVLALGGGVVSDLAGFAASAYLRGVNWIAAPTSLLGMADASLGGKTGVDLPQGKNLVGAFHPPRLVLADPHTLETLPEAELRSGLAEAVKSGVIADAQLFALCAQGWQTARAHLGEIVRRSMAVKIAVIQDDPYEQGRRAVLNLGHTMGHAVELVSGYRLRHGEAVAIGMVVEARLAEQIGLAQAGLAAQIEAALAGLGLPVSIPAEMDRQAILAAMRMDKKRRAGSLRFALPLRLGEVLPGVEVSDFAWLYNEEVRK
ncbi:MAG: 3-dehydroquinate synthase [Chloroflexi bacterium]|nr:3-dehydroquinate synthase [Chloroflexota bacterium]